jgi:hypothetical protein
LIYVYLQYYSVASKVNSARIRSYLVIENERFGLVFAKTGSIISGTVTFTIRETFTILHLLGSDVHMKCTVCLSKICTVVQSTYSIKFADFRRHKSVQIDRLNPWTGCNTLRLKLDASDYVLFVYTVYPVHHFSVHLCSVHFSCSSWSVLLDPYRC